MRAKAVRRMPIVDALGTLVGIVTADDLLQLLSEEMSALAAMTHAGADARLRILTKL
jgi:CBS domain-containing protein